MEKLFNGESNDRIEREIIDYRVIHTVVCYQFEWYSMMIRFSSTITFKSNNIYSRTHGIQEFFINRFSD